MTYSNRELQKLSSRTGVVQLLSSPVPDFEETLRMLNYSEQLEELQVRLIQLQNWVSSKNKRLLVIFEGREFCGKSIAIRALTEHLNPRTFEVVALPKPSIVEKGQWYFQRYIPYLPNPGKIILFDRSWYNRAIVEPVNGFCSQKQYKRFMREVLKFESMLHEDGIICHKLYFSISREVQEARLDEIKANPLRRWELSPVDKNALELWPKYQKYEKAMLSETHTAELPWKVLDGNDDLESRLEAIKHILKQTPSK